MSPLGAGATLAAVALPLLVAAAMTLRLLRPLALWCAPWAALPALVLAVGLHGGATVGWALLGMHLGPFDPLSRGFLFVTASLWLASGLFARTYVAGDPNRARFWVFFLVTLTGNIGLVLAQDIASFYVFYAIMTFAAYGLVAHEQTAASRRAGRVYLVMALAGEMLLLTAFFLLVGTSINIGLQDVPRAVAASARSTLVVGLLLAGFGVKAGALLLHMWLPLAHPVAPTPASAVLSGAMIKAGLLGWLRFLPLGVVAMPAPGLVCVVAGVAAAFYGALVGVTQRDPKTILAYSSVSQMGFMTAALGVGLADVNAAPALVAAILFFAMHHALAKGALFLGTGVAKATGSGFPGRLVALGLLWPAWDVAGAPLSSGALAKISLKNGAALSPWAPATLSWLLSVAAVGSVLLMVTFLLRTAALRSPSRLTPSPGLWVPWALLILLNVGLLATPAAATADRGLLLRPDKLWAAAWPVAVGIAIALGVRSLRRRGARIHVEIPPGDLLALFNVDAMLKKLRPIIATVRAVFAVAFLWRWGVRIPTLNRVSDRILHSAERAEATRADFLAIGLLFLLLVVFALAAQVLSTK